MPLSSESISNSCPEPRTINGAIHDLNNAIAPATLRIDLLLATELDGQQRLECLQRIKANLARARDLISALEDLVAAQK